MAEGQASTDETRGEADWARGRECAQPRLDLVAHVRELIGSDPEGYVRRRLPYVVGRLLEDVG